MFLNKVKPLKKNDLTKIKQIKQETPIIHVRLKYPFMAPIIFLN